MKRKQRIILTALCKLRKEEDFPHVYGECEALVDLRNSERAKRAHWSSYYNCYKEYIDSLDSNKRVHKVWFFMELLNEEVAQKIAELATKSKSKF